MLKAIVILVGAAAILFFSLPRRIRAAVHRQIDIWRVDRKLVKTAEDL